jgi:hypothetical protein
MDGAGFGEGQEDESPLLEGSRKILFKSLGDKVCVVCPLKKQWEFQDADRGEYGAETHSGEGSTMELSDANLADNIGLIS